MISHIRHPFIKKIITFLHRTEDIILISLLLVMIFIAVTQIFLRNFFDSGILWGDSLVRVLVLWIGLLGAMVASRTNNHIKIDIISRYLSARLKKLSGLVIEIFTAFVCGTLSWIGINFIRMEMQFGNSTIAGIPSWICELIIPIAFSVICLRYAFMSLDHLIQFIRSEP